MQSRKYGYNLKPKYFLLYSTVVIGLLFVISIPKQIHPFIEFDNYTHAEALKSPVITTKAEVVGMIAKKSVERKLDPILSLRIAFCESSYNPKAKNPSSTASGLYMFTKPTWLEGIRKRGLDWTWENVKDPAKNLDMFLWYYEQGKLNKWNASKHCWKR